MKAPCLSTLTPRKQKNPKSCWVEWVVQLPYFGQVYSPIWMFWIVNLTLRGQIRRPLADGTCPALLQYHQPLHIVFFCVFGLFFFFLLYPVLTPSLGILGPLGDKWMSFTWRCPLLGSPHASSAFCLWAGWCLAAAYRLRMYFVEHAEYCSGWQSMCACSTNSPALQWIFLFSQLHQKSSAGTLLDALVQKQEKISLGWSICLGDWFGLWLVFFLSCLMVF